MSDNEIKITYETLFDILRSEKKSRTIQKLPKSFFDDVLEYMKQKYDFLFNTKTEDIFLSLDKEKGLRELNNLKTIVKEIVERRIKKICELAIISVKTNSASSEVENLLDEEKILYESILENLKGYYKGVIDNLMNFVKVKYTGNHMKKEETKKDESKYILVRFLNPMPRFIGPDLKIYGPFLEDDIAKLPKRIAEALIKKKRAEPLE